MINYSIDWRSLKQGRSKYSELIIKLLFSRFKTGPEKVQTLSLLSKVKIFSLDDSYIVAASDTSLQVFKRENLEKQLFMINTHPFNCIAIELSTNFIIAYDERREIRAWRKHDGEMFTTLCINKCINIERIRCGTNDILITEYNTYAPKPSMFAYQVNFFVSWVWYESIHLFFADDQPKTSL